MTTIQGSVVGTNKKVAIIKARFNEFITNQLHEGALAILGQHDVQDDHIDTIVVPGAVEIVYAAKQAVESGHYDGVITIGAVIRGETPHFDYVCNIVSSGITQLNTRENSNCPVVFGVITTNTNEEAIARTGIKHDNQGSAAARAVLEMINLDVKQHSTALM
ncbi:6,7-dimethyl-8-ribityllumazine synthase [Geomicrobium sp. JCM 19055]|uniref:6,7-dimethyl-8-ribityllumazine synthase n=1 Tax=Geomicrobium sp. JCM 19055 TaxID=1460649 RepID=UPI00045ED99C|nr:6,7-dimethyl-8-ribityllumazine synthase [Geomicrobium sp. JCM 19055]GAK01436.1 6,7-dimethyl-8-ribityllumazine synthase [Geomicrobium sp. JCM 19055]